MEEEEWRPVEGAEGYEISNRGRVRSYWKYCVGGGMVKSNQQQRILSLSEDKNGYYKVGLRQNKRVAVHRLMAIAFIENPHNKPQVDHIDGNIKNNSLNNLRWATSRENILNSKLSIMNTSGYKGVSYRKNRWRARWTEETGKLREKNFSTLEEALEHRDRMFEEHYREFQKK